MRHALAAEARLALAAPGAESGVVAVEAKLQVGTQSRISNHLEVREKVVPCLVINLPTASHVLRKRPSTHDKSVEALQRQLIKCESPIFRRMEDRMVHCVYMLL